MLAPCKMLCLTSASLRLPSNALTRLYSSTRVHMVRTQDLSPSAGEDPGALVAKATELVDQGKWQLCNDGKGLERGFKFKTFKSTWVSTVFGLVSIRFMLTTAHSPS